MSGEWGNGSSRPATPGTEEGPGQEDVPGERLRREQQRPQQVCRPRQPHPAGDVLQPDLAERVMTWGRVWHKARAGGSGPLTVKKRRGFGGRGGRSKLCRTLGNWQRSGGLEGNRMQNTPQRTCCTTLLANAHLSPGFCKTGSIALVRRHEINKFSHLRLPTRGVSALQSLRAKIAQNP